MSQKLTRTNPKGQRKELPLRNPVSATVYDYLMGLTKPKHTSRYVWGRNRVAITLLRFCGLRASDVASITMKDINLGIRQGSFQVFQPKTNRYRAVVLTQKVKIKLRLTWIYKQFLAKTRTNLSLAPKAPFKQWLGRNGYKQLMCLSSY